jgi:hypothetical protein
LDIKKNKKHKMENTKIKTDDISFGLFLSTMDTNALIEIVRENLNSEVVVKVILENDDLQNDCITILFNDEINLPTAFKKKMLVEELNLSEDDEIMNYMSLLFSKKMIINTILEYSDEGARLDIIETLNSWNPPPPMTINYN